DAIDHFISLTTGVTIRPFPQLSASLVARDWNEPTSRGGRSLGRSWVLGLGGRPTGLRTLEAAWDLVFYEHRLSFGGHGRLGLALPRIGRLRGDITLLPPPDQAHGPARQFVATAGVEVNYERFQASAGGVFGNALPGSSTGLYAGAAFRTFREPGLRLPVKVARVRVDQTPGVRGNTRLLRRLWRLADDPEIEGVVLDLRAEPPNSLPHAQQ